VADQSPGAARAGGADPLRASQRIAVGTLARSIGEVVAKLASLVLYIAIARELGQAQFGDFIFGISLSTVLMISAGLGMQELIAREVAKDRRHLHDLLWNVLSVKGLMLLAVLTVVVIVAVAKGYPLETGAAIVVIGVAVGIEYQTNTFYAVFQGVEQNHHVATSLIVNRISTTLMALAVLAAGGGILAVALAVTLGSVFGLAVAYLLLRRYVARPKHEITPGRWRSLIKLGLPLGLVALLNQSLLRMTVIMLGFLAGSAAVGEYGAAFRLIEATMFVGWAFGGAILPWFSRHTGEGAVSMARGYEMVTKTMVTLLLPIALVFALFAEPLVELLYGSAYDGAVTPLRLLAAMTVLYGINSLVTAVLIGRDRPSGFTRPAAVVIAQSIVFSVILIPPYGADGAAITALSSSALLVALSFRNTTRLLGSISPARVLVAPLLAAGALALTVVALSGLPWFLTAAAGLGAYGLAFLVIERLFFPGDFAFYAGMFRVRDEAPAPG
jgi:O-antigen/teichoic acid export membrane protein